MDIFDEKEKYFPMLAGVSQEDFFSEKNIHLWKVFRTFPQRIQEILKSREITKYIFTIEQKYHLNDAQTEELSRSVRRYFFRELSEDAFVQHVAQVCGIPPQDGVRIVRDMMNITPAPQQDEEETQQPQRHVVTLPLEQALRQYPAIKDQMVTGMQIVMRSLPQPLKPSVKNWIMVYEKVLGASKHSAMERGEFVFRSEPTRGLSQDDRNKLAMILKSRDEGTPLTIDRDQRYIVFDAENQSVGGQQPTYSDTTAQLPDMPTEAHSISQSREGVIRRNSYSPSNQINYSIRNAVQSVRSSGGFVPQQRGVYAQPQPQSQPQTPQVPQQPQQTQPQQPYTQQAQVAKLTQPSRPQWGQTPVSAVQKSAHRDNMQSQQLSGNAQQMMQYRGLHQKTQPPQQPKATQKQEASKVSQRRESLEAPQTIALQSGYGKMVPAKQTPNNLPAVQSQTSSIHGTISFSSNHNLPIERKKHHTLQSTKKYLSPHEE